MLAFLVSGMLVNDLALGLNRYPPYARAVAAHPHAAYIFGDGLPQALALAADTNSAMRQYRRLDMDGYVVYVFQP